MSDINCRMPAVALRGLVCLPDMILHFDVSRKKSIAALEAAMVKDQMVSWWHRKILMRKIRSRKAFI